ncbi:TIGR03364 family FAD-dependent oxidoreductase [Saccharopolyspora erythraea]|uniref:TIGR03364 family FAD-dependent oxidoreductase n=1 Tax=Saccharopolyspora erythraea TaxID=1836 RepID=UPI001BAE1D36|nr:TIGR03364 family FAD-dependent oxidoreductase [Saccharopolyspora erythraea]QUH05033.1 TIGR03364 family FAD-dependent oxidoreductase [Saccharopolyspora erythraea]
MRVLIVGGGALGTMHALRALENGHHVVQLEREPEARGASVRNFGLVWVSGREPGPDLELALRAREAWERIGADVPGVGFRPNGSLTLLRTDAEVAVAEGMTDLAERGAKLVGAAEARALNPVLRGDFRAALWCERDGAVESRVALPALRAHLEATGRYTWLPGREVRDAGEGWVRDDTAQRHEADAVVLCTGAALGGLVRELRPELPVRRVRLQMMQTDPLGEELATSIADGDSLRYYPAYRGAALDELNRAEPQPPVAAENGMQLLMVQRLDGGLTIGDTHEYAEPFPFDVREEPYDHLVRRSEELLGRSLPRVTRRWAGVYAQTADKSQVVHREQVRPGIWLVTGPGGRGMTGSPAIAEDTLREIEERS